MTNGLDQFQKINQDGMETAMKSFGAAQEGFQAIATELADYSKKSFEDGRGCGRCGRPSPPPR